MKVKRTVVNRARTIEWKTKVKYGYRQQEKDEGSASVTGGEDKDEEQEEEMKEKTGWTKNRLGAENERGRERDGSIMHRISSKG